MPIRVNLLAEAMAAEELRRRDPVKRAIYVGVFCVVLMLVWSSSLMLETMLAKNSLNQIQSAILEHTNEFDQVTLNLKKISETQKRVSKLQTLSTNRFMQGTLLNALQQISVAGVQLTRMHVDQAYIYKEGSAGQTNNFGVIAGKSATATERIVLTLDARDYSANPGDGVNKYKDALAKNPYFQSSLDKTNAIRLASPPSPQSGVDGRSYVQFTLECRYPDQSR